MRVSNELDQAENKNSREEAKRTWLVVLGDYSGGGKQEEICEE